MILTEKLQKYWPYQKYWHEHFTSENILPTNQSRMIQQGTFTYSGLWKSLEKYIIRIEDQRIEQIDVITN